MTLAEQYDYMREHALFLLGERLTKGPLYLYEVRVGNTSNVDIIGAAVGHAVVDLARSRGLVSYNLLDTVTFADLED